ncbi:hypothetical protein [Nocardioides litoris]|uniref:hypothetical protein n=1 Tax=Nocardioides litoris TaxID=1926648 RepID=UPI001122F6E9|nr:hypothetical protein [Nocardioides litoris]
MPDDAPAVRRLEPADLDWLVERARARRERLAAHAPRLWRPAADATERHRAFLGRLLADPATTARRTDRGYALGLAGSGGARTVVDDMDVDEDAWATEGVALLRSFAGPVRLVAPTHELARRAAAEAVGLAPVESWWHRDLPLVQVRGEGGRVQLSAAGATGRLVPAPPVHDPGGSVLLVTGAPDAASLDALEAEAAERGATVSVVVQRVGDLSLELLLTTSGHVRTTDFLEGVPA